MPTRSAISLDETTRRSEVERLICCFRRDALKETTLEALDRETRETIPPALARQSAVS